MNRIAKTVLAIVLLFPTNILLSQEVPQGIYYQAVARGESGTELIETSLVVRINLEDEDNLVYTELHSPTTDSFGLFELFIGAGDVEFGEFSTISWGAQNHFLNVELDLGDGFIDVSTTQFLSVPYSLYSARAASADNVNDADADPNNELIQNFSTNGTDLVLTENGETWSIPLIDISDDGDWNINTGNSSLTTEGFSVGVNNTNPQSTFEVNGSFGLNTVTVLSDLNETIEADLGRDDSVVLCDVVSGSIIANLPDAEICTGRTYFIKRFDSSNNNYGFSPGGTLTVAPMPGQSIDNKTIVELDSNTWEQLTIISNGSNWYILSYNTNPQ
tara:strand:- start:373 stop:1365 length:993 start_codon:yes stop_codon:yes gene_type:complete